jgi:hypothetical protein
MFVTFSRTSSEPLIPTQQREGSVAAFQSVQEWDNEFLALFPHRFDYIFAKHPEPEQSPAWQTESCHPLSDRLLSQGAYLFGVRFGSQTQYCLLDIDRSSIYHPHQDAFAISRIQAALEPLGLVEYVACTSSYSSGLHLYFPFQEAQNSWELASGIATLLEHAGFKIKSGQLEIFPNPKPYAVEGSPSLFNAHRLPMQAGSYLLNKEFHPIFSTQQSFLQHWKFAQQRNALSAATLKQLIKQTKRKYYRVSGRADKFINDLNAEIEPGWTGSGQTNHLLGRITMREYVFRHVLSGGKPLEGQALADEVVAIARSLPGYRDWCRHQHEIEHRALEWAHCIENSHYFHYGDAQGKFKAKAKATEPIQASITEAVLENLPTWNQQQSEAARERIRKAIAILLETNTLPTGATDRFRTLISYGIGGSTLYRHRDLWHPKYLWKTPQTPPSLQECSLDCAEGTSNEQSSSSLFLEAGGNLNTSQASSPLERPQPTLSDRNFDATDSEDTFAREANDFAFKNIASLSNADRNFSSPDPGLHSKPIGQPVAGVQYVQQVLFDLKRHLKASQTGSRLPLTQTPSNPNTAYQTAQIKRMQRFLESGDPILIAEAQSWQLESGLSHPKG